MLSHHVSDVEEVGHVCVRSGIARTTPVTLNLKVTDTELKLGENIGFLAKQLCQHVGVTHGKHPLRVAWVEFRSDAALVKGEIRKLEDRRMHAVLDVKLDDKEPLIANAQRMSEMPEMQAESKTTWKSPAATVL